MKLQWTLNPNIYKLVLILLFVLAVALLNGCSTHTMAEKRAASAEQDQGEIIFGTAWPFEAGNDLFWEGVDLAVSEINASGGILDRQIKIIKKDDQASVTKGLEIAQAFSDNEEVVAVIGHRNSYVSIPVSSIYEKAGIVMLSPASSSPDLINGEDEFVFRNISSDERLAQEIANYAYENKHRKMVIMYDDDAYGEGLADAFEKQANELGMDIVDRLSYYSGTSNLAQLKFKWENLHYDGIFIGKSNPEGAQLIADLRTADIDVPLFGGNAMDTLDLWNIPGSRALEGTVIGSFFNPDSSRGKVKGFIKTFQETYKKNPSQYSVQGYDAVYLLAEAVKKAESTVPEKIASALRSLDDWEGVAGVHQFTEDGNDDGELVVIKKVKGSQFQYIAE